MTHPFTATVVAAPVGTGMPVVGGNVFVGLVGEFAVVFEGGFDVNGVVNVGIVLISEMAVVGVPMGWMVKQPAGREAVAPGGTEQLSVGCGCAMLVQ